MLALYNSGPNHVTIFFMILCYISLKIRFYKILRFKSNVTFTNTPGNKAGANALSSDILSPLGAAHKYPERPKFGQKL